MSTAHRRELTSETLNFYAVERNEAKEEKYILLICKSICRNLNSVGETPFLLSVKLNWNKVNIEQFLQKIQMKLTHMKDGAPAFWCAHEANNHIQYVTVIDGIDFIIHPLPIQSIALYKLPEARSGPHQIPTDFDSWKNNLLYVPMQWSLFSEGFRNIIWEKDSVAWGVQVEPEHEALQYKGPLGKLSCECIVKCFIDNLPALIHTNCSFKQIIGIQHNTRRVCGVVLEEQDVDEFKKNVTEPLLRHLNGYFPPLADLTVTIRVRRVEGVQQQHSLHGEQQEACSTIYEDDEPDDIGEDEPRYVIELQGSYSEKLKRACFHDRSAGFLAPHISDSIHLDVYMRLRTSWRAEVEECLVSGLYLHILFANSHTQSLSGFFFDHICTLSNTQQANSIMKLKQLKIGVLVLNSSVDVHEALRLLPEEEFPLVIMAATGRLALEFLEKCHVNFQISDVLSSMYPITRGLNSLMVPAGNLRRISFEPDQPISSDKHGSLVTDTAKRYLQGEQLPEAAIQELVKLNIPINRDLAEMWADFIDHKISQTAFPIWFPFCKRYNRCGATTMLALTAKHLVSKDFTVFYVNDTELIIDIPDYQQDYKYAVLIDEISASTAEKIVLPSHYQKVAVVYICKSVTSSPHKRNLPVISPFLNRNEASNLCNQLSAYFEDSCSGLQSLLDQFEGPDPYARHMFMYVLTAMRGTSQSVEQWVEEELSRANSQQKHKLGALAFTSVFSKQAQWKKTVFFPPEMVLDNGGLVHHDHEVDTVDIRHAIVGFLILKKVGWIPESSPSQSPCLKPEDLAKLQNGMQATVNILMEHMNMIEQVQVLNSWFIERHQGKFSLLIHIVFHSLKATNQLTESKLAEWLMLDFISTQIFLPFKVLHAHVLVEMSRMLRQESTQTAIAETVAKRALNLAKELIQEKDMPGITPESKSYVEKHLDVKYFMKNFAGAAARNQKIDLAEDQLEEVYNMEQTSSCTNSRTAQRAIDMLQKQPDQDKYKDLIQKWCERLAPEFHLASPPQSWTEATPFIHLFC